MKIFKLLLATVFCGVLTSCLGGDNSMTASRSLQSASCFNYVTDLSTGKGAINATGATYLLNIDYTNQYVDISVSGLQLTPNGASYSFNIPQVKYSFDATGAMVLNVNSHIDTGNNVSISNFRLKFLDRMIGAAWIPVWSVSYDIDSRYEVRTVQNSTYYFGKSEVITIGDDKYFETKEPYYCISFDTKTLSDGNKMKGKLYLYNVQFSSSMPKMNMAIRDIEFTLDETSFKAAASKLDLYVDDNVIRPDYGITDFALNATYDQRTFGDDIMPCCNIGFVCAGRFKTTLELGYDIPSAETQK